VFDGGAGAATYISHGADVGFAFLGGAVGYVIAEPAVGLPFYLVKKILYDAPKEMLRKKEEVTP
jgi:hypothetical protein